MDTSPTTPSESPLAAGCLLYRRMLDTMNELQEALQLCSTADIERLLHDLDKLQGDAVALDKQINAEILGEPAAASFVAQRGDLLKELLVKNQELQKSARKCQTLYVHEMTGLRRGISALQGYKSSLNRSGKMLNSSF
jgi:hypothetical protein